MLSSDRLLGFAATAFVVIVIPGPQILVLGLVFAAIAVLSDTLWAFAAGAFRNWFARSPRRLELVGGVGGLGIAAVGAGFLVSGRKD